MRYPVLFASLLLASQVAAIVVKPLPAAALSAIEVNSVANQVTVKIFGGGTIGTGIIVRKQGDRYTVLTAGHVVKDNITYRVIAPDGQTYTATTKVHSATGIDLAAIAFTSPKIYAVANISDSATMKIGEPIYTAGFPGIKPTYTFGSGQIEANSNSDFRQGYSLIYQCQKIAPGMSGGGVFNSRGELIAVTGMSIGHDGAAIREGLAAGIGSRRFVHWAETANVPLGKSFASDPDKSLTADDFLVTAMDKSDRRDPRGAIADYDRAIALKPDYALAYYRRGLSKERIGDRQSAIADHSRAIALKPAWVDAYLSRGANQGGLGDWQSAINDYNVAISLRPNDFFARTTRGLYKSILGDLNGSLTDYNLAIALRPNYADAYKSRAVVKEKLGDRQGAIADYGRAIALKPHLAQTYERRAAIKHKLNDRQGAMMDLSTAAQLYHRQGYLSAYHHSIDRLHQIFMEIS